MANRHGEPEVEFEDVDCIASGYEWECPGCEELNHIPAYPGKREGYAVCKGCRKAVRLSLPEHAID